MAQVFVKKVCCTCVIPLHLAMFHPSFARLSLSLSRLSRPHVLAVLTCLKSAGACASPHEDVKFGYLAKSALNTGYDPKEFDKITSADGDTTPINDPNYDNISNISKITRETTGLLGVSTMFESSVSHVSHDDFALQIESKESMHRETDC